MNRMNIFHLFVQCWLQWVKGTDALNNASCEARRNHRYESVTKYLALDRANLFRFGALAAPALAASWQAIEGATPNVQVHPVPQNISTTYALAPRIC